jgi:hypothetical protein
MPCRLALLVVFHVTLSVSNALQYAYTLAWSRKDGQPLPSYATDDGQGTLFIRSIRKEDEGTYVCTGSNMYTTARNEARDEAVLRIVGK